MRRFGEGGMVSFDPKDPLGSWRREVSRLEKNLRTELGLGARDRVRPGALVSEVIRLADPTAVRGRDAVIPGGRRDLVQAWMRARLTGRGEDPRDRLALAHEIAPAPDESVKFAFRHKRSGQSRYRYVSALEAAVTRAAKEEFEGSPPFAS